MSNNTAEPAGSSVPAGSTVTIEQMLGGGESWFYALKDGEVLGAAHRDDASAMQRLYDIQKQNIASQKPIVQQPRRHVMIDIGYNLSENWIKAKVIRSQMCIDPSTGSLKEQLLVERSAGERMWVAFWKEMKNHE